MHPLLPPSPLRAALNSSVLNRPSSALPSIEDAGANKIGRRSFLQVAGAALALFGSSQSAQGGPLVFSPEDLPENVELEAPAENQLRLGEFAPDFWYQPRELWLKRQGTHEEVRVVYWRDGKLVSPGYWQACAMLRDVHVNVMTTMDPTILDILRGISGYYEAWRYRQPLVLTSGFRTLQTNRALSKEGAAHNSMHLYGRAVDLYVPGVPARDIGILGMHLRQGGVGFYPSKGFTHLDTGKLRTWRGG